MHQVAADAPTWTAVPSSKRQNTKRGKNTAAHKPAPLQASKSYNAPLLNTESQSSNQKTDLRIHLSRNRAARKQQQQQEIKQSKQWGHEPDQPQLQPPQQQPESATPKPVLPEAANLANKRKKKKKPLPSFMPDYESPNATSTTMCRTSSGMIDDASLHSSGEVTLAVPDAEAAEAAAASSPHGEALLRRKVSSQQAKPQADVQASAQDSFASSPYGKELMLRKVANQLRRGTSSVVEVSEVRVIEADEFAAVLDAAANESADILVAEAVAAEAVAAAETPVATTETTEAALDLRFNATTKSSWLSGQCVAAVSIPLIASTTSVSTSAPATSPSMARRMALGGLLALTIAVALVASGGRVSSRSTSSRA